MKKFIITLLIAILFIGGLIYFVFSSDKSLSVTYIKFSINPEFVIGVNSDDRVSIYNPINEASKVFNLSMFNGKTLEDAVEVVLDVLEENKYFEEREMYITVITKNPDKVEHYYQKINSVILKADEEITLVTKNASNEELIAYSNEVAYDINTTYSKDDLIAVSSNLEEQIKKYVEDKLIELDIEKLDITKKQELITTKKDEGYFNDFELLYYEINDYNLKILESSNYNIEFVYNSETVNYNIILDLVLECRSIKEDKDGNYHLVEEYHYTYSNNDVTLLKNNFYKYN